MGRLHLSDQDYLGCLAFPECREYLLLLIANLEYPDCLAHRSLPLALNYLVCLECLAFREGRELLMQNLEFLAYPALRLGL